MNKPQTQMHALVFNILKEKKEGDHGHDDEVQCSVVCVSAKDATKVHSNVSSSGCVQGNFKKKKKNRKRKHVKFNARQKGEQWFNDELL